MSKISLFKNCRALKPFTTLSLPEIVKNIKTGIWEEEIETLRESQNELRQKALKKKLIAFTLCGECVDSRDVANPSGYIGIDIDAKDHKENVLEKFSMLCQDKYIHAAWPSSRGSGLRLVFKINPAKHEESFLGIEKYLYKKYSLTVDRDCKDINRLSYASYAPNAYMGYKGKKTFRQVIEVPKIPEAISSSAPVASHKEISDRIDLIVKAEKDITAKRENWISIGVLCASLGENGRKLFHGVSKFYPKYSEEEVNLKFNDLSRSVQRNATPKNKVTTATLDFLMRQYGVIKLNGKMKLNLSNGNGTTEAIYASDMQLHITGNYLYDLLEFKVLKKDKFKCIGVNNQRVTEWLHKNMYRVFDKVYYHIENNVIKKLTFDQVYNNVYKYGIEKKLPKNIQFQFDVNGDPISKDAVLDAAIKNCKKVLDTLPFTTDFNPDDKTKFLQDTRTEIHLKFSDTVVKVIGNTYEKIPYSDIKGYVWEKSILPFKFTTSKEKSSVQLILDKCIGEENRDAYMTTVGFMISSFLPPEENLMLFCIDLNTKGLNNGGNGKDFIRQILEQVRNVAKIPGENFDPKREFATAWGDRDTEVIWFEDLKEGTKMRSFYNFSNGVPIRRLHAQPFYVKAKVGVSLQYAIDIEGSSNRRRQLFLLFKEYFSLLPKGIFSEFKSVFATDWPDAERAKFNSFIIKCCQKFLTLGVKQMPIDELIEARKEEVESSMFQKLEIGKRYTLQEAMDYLQRQGYEIRTTDPKFFKRYWYAHCELVGKYLDDSYRTEKARYYTMLNSKPVGMQLTKGGKAIK